MIKSLHISNFALIDEIDVTFSPGFNVITGETGAGKSIILGALGALMGNRLETKQIVNDRKTVVEAVFDTAGYDRPLQLCSENDIDWNGNECILRREITPAGRSRAFINDTPVSLALLREMGAQLIDIHSQHQNQLISSAEFQLEVLDAISDTAAERTLYAAQWEAYRETLNRYRIKRRQVAEARQNEDYARFQLSQLEEMKLQTGEQEELERERDIIMNLADVKGHLAGITDALAEGEYNVLSLLKSAIGHAGELSRLIDGTQSIAERLEALNIEARDIAESYADIDRSIDADPSRLEGIEQRLNDIYDLERRHKAESVDQLIEIRDNLRKSLADVEEGDDMLKELENKARHAKRVALETAKTISAKRQEAALHFATALKETAMPLGMKNLRCQIAVTQGEMTATGIDTVEFLFAFNKNQALSPVGATASGGEISRLMLSLKSIVASRMKLPSIIFDEVDTGVSGDVASRMGQMMRQISGDLQVITITHLPQVASLADTHLRVYKEDTETATNTRINLLDHAARIEEIAAMLSADKVNEAARANAISLLSNKPS